MCVSVRVDAPPQGCGPQERAVPPTLQRWPGPWVQGAVDRSRALRMAPLAHLPEPGLGAVDLGGGGKATEKVWAVGSDGRGPNPSCFPWTALSELPFPLL